MSVWLRRIFWVGVATSATFGVLYLAFLGRGMTYGLDEWVWVARRMSWSLDSVLVPHNGHNHALAALFYLLVFRTVGLNHPEIFRMAVLLIHVGIAASVAVLVAKRHGRALAALAGLAVLYLGKGAQNIVWGFQIGMAGSVLFLLVAVILFQSWESRQQRRWLVLSSLSLLVSVLFSSVGIAAVAAMTLLVLTCVHRRRVWWLPLPAVVVYGAWYAKYAEPVTLVKKPEVVVRWMWNSACENAGAFFDLGHGPGRFIAAGLIVGVVYFAWRRRASSNLIVWTTFVVGFWAMTGMTRSFFVSPNAGRYMHVSMIGTILAVGSLGSSTRAARRWLIPLSAILVAVSAIAQFPGFRAEVRDMRANYYAGSWFRGSLSIAELLRKSIDSSVPLVKFIDVPLVTEGDYLRTIEIAGTSPAYPIARLADAPASVRYGADAMINNSAVVRIAPTPEVGCSVVGKTHEVKIDGGRQVRVRTSAVNGLMVRRFHPEGPSVINWREVPVGDVTLSVPSDVLRTPWILAFSAPVEQLACPAR